MIPAFSLLHASARPFQWEFIYQEWMESCDYPSAVQYVLAIHTGDAGHFDIEGISSSWGSRTLEIYTGRRCSVDGWNAAARASHGSILVCVADDFFPPPHWDTELLKIIPDVSLPYTVHVNAQDPWPGLMTHPILTRAYYEQPGRGGCPGGELCYPEYISVGWDDDFTEYAYRDGVVIDARSNPALLFEHRHPTVGKAVMDNVYHWEVKPECWEVKERVIARRRKENFAH